MRDILIIILLIICTANAVKDTVRINSRRAQQRIRCVRKPIQREVRLLNKGLKLPFSHLCNKVI